jgi:glyoxylase-like metal-dependent hydrolase (beta-lactamase superfamily II)
VRPASDFLRVASNIAIWNGYDSSVKAELCSTCLITSDGSYLIDPIPLQRERLDELIGSSSVTGIMVTNGNHHRASARLTEQLASPIIAHRDSFSDKQPSRFREVVDGEAICDGVKVIGIEGAVPGEIILHNAGDGGALIVGDALINFEPYGLTFLPAKYCSNQRQMRRSLRKLLDYKARRMLFAHGRPIISGASERLRCLLDSDF